MSVQTKISVSTIICNRNHDDPAKNLYLMVEEMTDDGIRINQPTGHLELGETPEEGAIREVLEETKHNIYIASFIGAYLYTRASNAASFMRLCFHGVVSSIDNTVPEDEDKTIPLWLTYEQIANREAEHRNPMVMACLDDFIANNYCGINKHVVQTFSS